MVDFAKYKANRDTNKDKLAEFQKKQEAESKQTYESEDTRFWKPVMDKKAGVGGAVIRFLPEGNEENLLNYVTYYEHSFKNPDNDKWYIERSLSSVKDLGQDSIAILNAKLWKTSSDKDHPHKKIASRQKRNQKFIANILVVNDPANPENNGKVFLYKFGPAIYKKIKESQFPVENPITKKTPKSIDPFDIIDGADMEIYIKDTANGWNYDETKFSQSSPMAKSDAVFDAILRQVHTLDEFAALSNYKSNDALNKRLIEVLGTTYQGFEVVEGWVGKSSVESSVKTQQTHAPVQKESTPDDLPFEPDLVITEASAQSASDEEFFNNLMQDA